MNFGCITTMFAVVLQSILSSVFLSNGWRKRIISQNINGRWSTGVITIFINIFLIKTSSLQISILYNQEIHTPSSHTPEQKERKYYCISDCKMAVAQMWWPGFESQAPL